jgi:hypothetical protein
VVWTMLVLRPGGFPWISVCGCGLAGRYVLDLDATIVACTSAKEGAAGTFKGGFGHMPLGAWVANTRECVAMLLRPGNAPPNDVDAQTTSTRPDQLVSHSRTAGEPHCGRSC